jgi:hypothetical protein
MRRSSRVVQVNRISHHCRNQHKASSWDEHTIITWQRCPTRYICTTIVWNKNDKLPHTRPAPYTPHHNAVVELRQRNFALQSYVCIRNCTVKYSSQITLPCIRSHVVYGTQGNAYPPRRYDLYICSRQNDNETRSSAYKHYMTALM